MTRALCLAIALAALSACAAPAVQQPQLAPSPHNRFNAAFGDLRTEENRDERRQDGCRSNGDATASDAEDCQVLPQQ
ncbi:MAG: hypothetical protein Q7T01_03150 [bacterium]|nr:hypothetical protein [bacterium]